MSSNVVRSVISDPRNLARCYEQEELAWKRGSLKTGHFYLQNLTKNGPKARQFCGGVFVDYDLYPDEDHTHLWLDDGRGKDLCLTNRLPLEKVFSTANHNDDGTGWFTSVYQKHDTSVPDDYYSRVLEHAAHSLKKRHEWALDLESLIESQFRSYK